MKKTFLLIVVLAFIMMTTNVFAATANTASDNAATQGIFTTLFLHIVKFCEVYVYFIAFTVFWCVDKRLGRLMILSGAIATELSGIGKLLTGAAFPSGRTANATFSYGLLGYHNRKYKIISWSLYVFVVLVMIALVYEGFHTPQEVIGGLLITVLIIFLVDKLLQWVEGGPNRDLIASVCTILFFISCMFYFQLKINQLDAAGKLNIGNIDPKTIMPYIFWMTGLLVGAFLGWVIERRFVKFTTNVHISYLFARFLTGWLAFIFINFVCSNIFILMLGSNWGSFFSTAVLGLYCIVIHPYLFTKFEKFIA